MKEENNGGKKSTTIIIIVIGVLILAGLGYLIYTKALNKIDNKGSKEQQEIMPNEQQTREESKETPASESKKQEETKKEEVQQQETKKTNKTEIINTTYGEFVIDYTANNIKIKAGYDGTGATQTVTIPGEKIKDATFYGTLGCTIAGKFVVILTESGNLYINKYSNSDVYKNMEFVRITDVQWPGYSSQELKYNGNELHEISEASASCGFANLGLENKESTNIIDSYKIHMTCDEANPGTITSAQLSAQGDDIDYPNSCMEK